MEPSGVVVADAPDPGVVYWVTEHVFEQQSVKNNIELMSWGLKADGTALTAGAPTIKGVFDHATGILFKPWPPHLKPRLGETPLESLFGILGHDSDGDTPADTTNLQVVDGHLNAFKAVTCAKQNFIGDAYNGLAPKQKAEYLADIINSFSYQKLSQVVMSYNSVYHSLMDIWTRFGEIPGAQSGYDYAGATKEIVASDLSKQVSTALGNFKPAAQALLDYWKSSTASARFTAAEVAAYTRTMQDLVDNAAVYISLDTAGMLK